MNPQRQCTPMERLRNLEKIATRLLELSDGIMEEMANPNGPKEELVNNQLSEFNLLSEDIQIGLEEETERINEHLTRPPFEICRSIPRISIEIAPQELDYIKARLDEIEQAMEDKLREIDHALLKENGIVGDES